MDFSSFTMSELAVMRAALCTGKFYDDATAGRLYVRVEAECQARRAASLELQLEVARQLPILLDL